MNVFLKVLAIAFTGMSLTVLAGCRDDFDYDYLTPPVTVTPASSSSAHYGPPASSSDAHYGSQSGAHYGPSVAPVPPVTVSPNSNSGAHYGN
jgi:hypothetical protein